MLNLSRWFAPARPAPNPSRPAAVRLRVERMEDRLTPTNVLWFGNSLTFVNGVQDLFRAVARGAGQGDPTVVARLPGGEKVSGHLAAVRNGSFGVGGRQYDAVVIQGQSTEAARQLFPGDYNSFVQSVPALASAVRGASPNARVVLYETFAYPTSAPTVSSTTGPIALYPSVYSGPAAMQADLSASYDTALAAVRGRVPKGASEIAPVGQAFGRFNHAGLQSAANGGPDYHQNQWGATLAALTIYSTVYGDNVQDIPYAAVSGTFAPLGVTAANWAALTQAADRAVGTENAAQNLRFLQGLYADLLGRSLDSGGQSYWMGILNAGTATRTQVAQAITQSDEFRAARVVQQFTRLIGTAPTAAERSFFVNAWRAGAKYEDILATIGGSDRYYQVAGGTPAGFVRKYCQDVLRRPAGDADVAFWTGALARGATRQQVAYGILNSQEWQDRVTDAWYQTILRRPADAGGLAYYRGLRFGGLPYETLIALVAGSEEYFARFE